MKKVYLLVAVFLVNFIPSCSFDDEVNYLDNLHKSSITCKNLSKYQNKKEKRAV